MYKKFDIIGMYATARYARITAWFILRKLRL